MRLLRRLRRLFRRPPRLCLFSHSAELAGAERSLLDLVRELVADHAVSCTVVLPTFGPLAVKLEAAGANCIVASYDWWCTLRDDRLINTEKVERLRRGAVAVIGLLPQLRLLDPDVIWTQTLVIPWGAVAAALLKKPHIWSVCEYGERDHDLRFFVPFKHVLADIVAGSDLIYTPSQAIGSTLFPQLPAGRVRTLYRHAPLPARIDGGGDRHYRRLGAVRLAMLASLDVSKGQADAIGAVGQLTARGRDVDLVLAGYDRDGAYRDELEQLAQRNKCAGRVHFLGFLPDPYPTLKAADVVLICSRSEAFGRVAVEAMRLGKAVVYPAAGSFPEFMQDGVTGLAYKPGHVAGLAARIEQLIDHPEQARAIAAAGKAAAGGLFTAHRYGGEVYRAVSALRRAGPGQAQMPEIIAPYLQEARLRMH